MTTESGYLFTSESVTEGHPDKISDQISDAVLDAALSVDPTARVACETLVTTGLVVVAGEITTNAVLDFSRIARETVREIGYTRAKYGFDCDTCAVLSALDRQSPDIAMGVDTGGAGDQGLMFGFACNETSELMPLPIQLAHLLARRLSEVRKAGVIPYLRPDGKTQVTLEYENNVPVRVDAIVVSSQHDEQVKHNMLKDAIMSLVIEPGNDLAPEPSRFDVLRRIVLGQSPVQFRAAGYPIERWQVVRTRGRCTGTFCPITTQ